MSENLAILNQQQQDMLRLFKNPMSEPDYIEIKRFIVKKLARNGAISDRERMDHRNI